MFISENIKIYLLDTHSGLDVSSGPAARVCRKFDRAAVVH